MARGLKSNADSVTFRYITLLRVMITVATLIAAAFLAVTNPEAQPWVFVANLGLTLFCMVGILESWVGYIRVGPDAVTVRGLFVTKRYPRPLVSKVTWAKGCPITLVLSDGTYGRLPTVGHGRKLIGAIQSWLSRTVA